MERLKRKPDARKPPKDGLKRARTREGRGGVNSTDAPEFKEKYEDRRKKGGNEFVDSRLWVDKHVPSSEGELAVNSRKVTEVKEWIQDQTQDHPEFQSRVLVLTGPAGVGKTAVVLVLAKSMDLELCEWTTPTPTLWHEYSHHACTGARYMSKFDDFEAFLEKARKFSSLPCVSVVKSQQRPLTAASRSTRTTAKVVLIDDLPNVHDKAHRQRLCKSLQVLAASSKFPTIVVVTDEIGTGEEFENRKVAATDIIQALERGGARKIAFNAITVNAIKKVLKRVQLAEKCKAPLESLSAIAESCSGDIRQALTSLQFACLGCHSDPSHSSLWDPGGHENERSDFKLLRRYALESTAHRNVSHTSTLGDRDSSLSLFHALGKFLHNKRHPHVLASSSSEITTPKLKEDYCRNPLNMAEPEIILSQAHAETATVAAFLHENILQFVDEEATDDVAAILAYLSDTDCLLSGEGSMRSRRACVNLNDIEPSQVANAAASSVAARGILFANAHPAPPRWQSLRAPSLWQVEREQFRRKVEISTGSLSGLCQTTIVSSSVQATELYPYSQRLPMQILPMQSRNILNAIKDPEGTPFLDEDEMEVDETNESAIGDKRTSCVLEPSISDMDVEDEIENW